MDKDMSFSNLLGCLAEFYHRMGFEDVRFRPGYFPYTEPSVEPEVYVDGLGWLSLEEQAYSGKKSLHHLESNTLYLHGDLESAGLQC